MTPAEREPGVEPERSPSRAQEDRALFERYLDRRDPIDREVLVERYLPLARQLARRYQRRRSRSTTSSRSRRWAS